VKRAVILAGGQGMRLRPYTTVIPKPLMPVGDRPVLDIVVRQLKHAGFERITIATGYLAELIEAFFGDGSKYDIPIDYFRETEPLGTVGSLALIDGLDEDFLVMNGDTLTDTNYSALLERHSRSGAAGTIATTEREVEISLGVLHFDENNGSDESHKLTGYTEKPQIKYQASMGVYCFAPRVTSHIERGERLDFPDLILRLLARGEEVRAWMCKDYWLDIGRHDDYEQAQAEFDRMRERLIPHE
jgi:NDP-sugar pyrophosphorylase family protein